jgi:hypothetical protein
VPNAAVLLLVISSESRVIVRRIDNTRDDFFQRCESASTEAVEGLTKKDQNGPAEPDRRIELLSSPQLSNQTATEG